MIKRPLLAFNKDLFNKSSDTNKALILSNKNTKAIKACIQAVFRNFLYKIKNRKKPEIICAVGKMAAKINLYILS